MSDQVNDFLKDYQAFAQQSWDAWMRYMQQSGAQPQFGVSPAASNEDLLTRSLSSLKAYGSWLQQAAGAAGLGQFGNWQQPAAMQPFLAAFNQPFAQTVAGIDSASAFGLDHQWQSWLQAMQRAGMGGMGGMGAAPGPLPAFGLTREMQLDQQALTAAIHEYLQITNRYQALLQQVNTKGIARLQEMLGQRAEPGKQIESMKALYDLWVDAMEEAYSEMALSDEFRDVFGALVNAQMQVRKLQQQQTEQMCRELGIPTRSEVDSLGQRVQQLRRELQTSRYQESHADASEVDALQAEIAELKRELAASKVAAKVRPITRKSGDDDSAAAPRAKAARSASGKRK
ncbi:poly(R)-hydroxyalkanoic acid synthase subunit PhaE [Dyella caseinilytica]|uniref:Poly(3-hydroxyalkanoate) polymerase subunit PhaE n=1 Tax=Dyella caseinilytica TaxID=1849581 RepID=A0ABX7GX60_9GAMM|nr:poly(R)-hydroxyalkanoic acid synthase subunit PhaE [Dyella caseinilytica]QRN55087.1 pha synthase subunit protein [Dyella caseinilytica]GFZ99292.1 class III poly(R)-hydroxyalkanoic acid synthase subunit PhaE [Dyella caseinilytica]